MNWFTRIILTLCVLCLALQAEAKSAAEVFEETAGSIVIVYGKDGKDNAVSLGSGVVTADGEVATNCHVIDKANSLSVRHKHSELPATRKHRDYDRDVCSLTVPGLKAPIAQLGSTHALKVGQRVYAIGAPYGLELTLSEGIISSLREVKGGRYIQITAPISAGSSGGGLFDDAGRLIGLPTFYLREGQQLNFAVPVEWVKALPQRETTAKSTTTAITAWINKAIELDRKHDRAGLRQHTQRWTKARPSDAEAWFFLGIAQDYGSEVEAIKAYQKALRINPEFAEAWFLLGSAYESAGKMIQAIEAYQQAVRVKPDDATSWYFLGKTYKRAGQSTRAIDAFQQAVLIKPEYTPAWSILGDAYQEAGKMAQSIDTYHQALRINPDAATIWLRLAVAYSESGQVEEEDKAYQQALRIEPDAATLWRRLGIEYHIYGSSKDKLMIVYRHLKSLDPVMADYFFSEFISR